jgi:hypothetical protein
MLPFFTGVTRLKSDAQRGAGSIARRAQTKFEQVWWCEILCFFDFCERVEFK